MSANRIKILITTSIFPPDIGGPATYVPAIAKALSCKGYEISVVTLSENIERYEAYPFRVIPVIKGESSIWRRLRVILRIILESRRADLLFANGLYIDVFLANMIMRKPLVLKVVGDLIWEKVRNYNWACDAFDAFQNKNYGLKIQILKILQKLWLNKANKIIVPSVYLKKWLIGQGIKKDKIIIINNAIEIPEGIKPAIIPLKTQFKVVTTGRLVRWKHIDVLIEVVSRINDLGLVVVGDGPEYRTLETLADMYKVKDRIYFTGQKSRKEVFDILAACDAFVLNSSYEGYPHAILEALALGLPVIATTSGGMPELFQSHKDIYAIKTADKGMLHSFLTNISKLKIKSAQSVMNIDKKYDFIQMTNNTESLLISTIQESKHK